MAHPEELRRLDQAWLSMLAGVEDLDAVDFGAFGHVHQRRLGLRVTTHCWALLCGSTSSAYAVAVELSATGVVLELVGRRAQPKFRTGQRFGLDLFVPGAASRVQVVVRAVRQIGQREAFEFVQVSAVDRLTLAEYIDRSMANESAVLFKQRSAS